jgi:hypothetical protein
MGAILGAIGCAGAGTKVWPTVLLPSLAGLVIIPLAVRGYQKTIFGEVLVVTAFTTLLPPLASAAGADMGEAVAASAVWWISFTLGTLEVHAIKARHKRNGKRGWPKIVSPLASGIAAGAASALVLGHAGAFGFPHAWAETGGSMAALGEILWDQGSSGFLLALPRAALALLPPAVSIFILALAKVHPRHLKRVGWTLVGANSLALAILLSG